MKTADRPTSEFDKYAASYQEMLDSSIAITGESGEYFAGVKARYVASILGAEFSGKLLDFGCGVGLLSRALAVQFPKAERAGFDLSKESIDAVDDELKRDAHFTCDERELRSDYDAIVVANVMHHVPVQQRQTVVDGLAKKLSAQGRLFIFEHNPANPLTRRAVDRCPFDADAVLLRPCETAGYLSRAGLKLLRRDFIVFVPRFVSFLRPLEPLLSWCPLGAQYVSVAKLG